MSLWMNFQSYIITQKLLWTLKLSGETYKHFKHVLYSVLNAWWCLMNWLTMAPHNMKGLGLFFFVLLYIILYILIQYSKLVELICQKKRNNQKRRYLRETFYIPWNCPSPGGSEKCICQIFWILNFTLSVANDASVWDLAPWWGRFHPEQRRSPPGSLFNSPNTGSQNIHFGFFHPALELRPSWHISS